LNRFEHTKEEGGGGGGGRGYVENSGLKDGYSGSAIK